MERLTQKTEKGFVIKLNNPKNEKEAKDQLMKMFAVAVNKLAAYEDTGLEPEEIKENEKIINDLTRAICTKDEEIKKLKSQLANTNGGKIDENRSMV